MALLGTLEATGRWCATQQKAQRRKKHLRASARHNEKKRYLFPLAACAAKVPSAESPGAPRARDAWSPPGRRLVAGGGHDVFFLSKNQGTQCHPSHPPSIHPSKWQRVCAGRVGEAGVVTETGVGGGSSGTWNPESTWNPSAHKNSLTAGGFVYPEAFFS